MSELRIWRRHKLPHWEREGATYFITFHISGSIPKRVIEHHKRALDSTLPLVRQSALLRRNLERYLDAKSTSLLRDPELASIVKHVILHGRDQQYELFAWSIMSNHVHVLCRLFSGQRLELVVQQWKSVSAHRINALRGESATVWQKEYFDRIIRNEQMHARVVRYVRNNPVVAGLTEWPLWVERIGWCRLRGIAREGAGTPSRQPLEYRQCTKSPLTPAFPPDTFCATIAASARTRTDTTTRSG